MTPGHDVPVLAALTPPPQNSPALRAVAVDGKTCRGAKQSGGARVHLLSAVEHATGTPLRQVPTTTKGHEIAAFATVLDLLDLTDVVVTADGLHTQKAHARHLHRHGGKYVFIVKRNQPSLHDQLAALPWSKVLIADQVQDGLSAFTNSVAGQTVPPPQLTANQRLNANDKLVNPTTAWELLMQDDGNLVIYDTTGAARWASNTYGNPGASALMQDDGNFVVYDSKYNALWATNTYGNPGSRSCFETTTTL